jgi:hypothetical protein
MRLPWFPCTSQPEPEDKRDRSLSLFPSCSQLDCAIRPRADFPFNRMNPYVALGSRTQKSEYYRLILLLPPRLGLGWDEIWPVGFEACPL